METSKFATAAIEAWELTRDEYKFRPQARRAEKDGVLVVDLDSETLSSMQRFSGKELSALARVIGARGKGKKEIVIQRIFSLHQARVALDAKTMESLKSLRGCLKRFDKRVVER